MEELVKRYQRQIEDDLFKATYDEVIRFCDVLSGWLYVTKFMATEEKSEYENIN